MTTLLIVIAKVDESPEWAKYAFGGLPRVVYGHVKIYKDDGKVEFVDVDDKYKKKYILLAVEQQLALHYQKGEFPEKTVYAA